MYKCARGASCAYHQLPRPAASHQMRGLIDFCTTPVTRQSHSILRGRTIKGRRSTKSCTGRLTQNALRCKLIKIASTNVIIVSVCCVSFSFSTAITSLKSHLSLHLRAKSCNFPIANRGDQKSHRDRLLFSRLDFKRGSFGKSNSPSLRRDVSVLFQS